MEDNPADSEPARADQWETEGQCPTEMMMEKGQDSLLYDAALVLLRHLPLWTPDTPTLDSLLLQALSRRGPAGRPAPSAPSSRCETPGSLTTDSYLAPSPLVLVICVLVTCVTLFRPVLLVPLVLLVLLVLSLSLFCTSLFLLDG
ncbi:hypothetical protein EV363DRAFT_1450046 [Boletus edulis]|nr:hypothetical protein EV363DRAFT_1450046 [Boletus edulis]